MERPWKPHLALQWEIAAGPRAVRYQEMRRALAFPGIKANIKNRVALRGQPAWGACLKQGVGSTKPQS